jgi:hypothetical protein
MRREYTAQDIEQFNKAGEQLRKNGLDEFTQEGIQRNADLLDEYFQQNRKIPVTVANVFKCVEARKQDFKWLSPAQLEYHRAAAENPAAAAKLAEFFAIQGRPGTLVNVGEDGFENSAILLTELRGREVNQTTIQQSIGRVAFNGDRQLHVVPTPRRVDPRSHAANDDGTPFLGEGLRKLPDGSFGKTPADYAREAVARSAKNSPSAADSVSVLENQAQREAESLQGNTHSETAQLGRVFITKPGSSSIDWVRTLNARKTMQNSFKRDRSIR